MAMIVGHSQTKYLDNVVTCPVFSYPGFTVRDILKETLDFYNVLPSKSTVALVIGANDIGRKSVREIVEDFKQLCQRLHTISPSATILVSEILPRGRNLFHVQSNDRIAAESLYLDEWNAVAGLINKSLRELTKFNDWMQIISQWEFHTLFGAARQFLGRDGLHLSVEGNEKLAYTIEAAIESVTEKCKPVFSSCGILQLQPCTESEFDISQRSQSSGWETVGSSGRRTSSSCVPRGSRAQSYVDVKCAPTSFVKTAIQNRRVYEVIRDIPSAPLSGGRYCPVSRASGKVKGTDHCTTRRKSASSTPKSSKSKRKDSVLINEHVILCESDSMFYLSTDVPSKLYGGGVDTPIFSTTERVISYGEASCILESSQSDSITIDPPYKPKEGSVYLYCDSGDTSKKDDWKADGYTWRHNGRKEYKVEGKVIERHFFKIKNQKTASNDFQKHVFRYTSSDYNGKTVLAYYGNSSAYQSMPHGNRRNNNRPFKRTKPSVLHKIKEATLTKDEPKEILEKIRSEISPETKLKGVSAPRNLKQIQNSKQTIKTEKKLSHDAMFALHLLVTQLDGYILSIKTTPDLEVVVGNKELFEEVKKLIQLKDSTVEIFYDTTFNLGDFYVSTVAIQHPMFKENPVIPIAFMLHERKFQSCHSDFVHILTSKIPNLNSTNVTIITDREKGIIGAFEAQLEKATVVNCWNHIFSDIKFWVSKHGGSKDDKKIYESNIKSLLQCQTIEDFEKMLSELKLTWSESFLNYFETNIYHSLKTYCARWILEERDIYNPYSGITNNVSESLNAMLKRLIEYKEKAVDEIVLFLYYMQGNMLAELIRAFCGESEWTLRTNYKYAILDPDTVSLPKNVCHPHKLIELIKGALSTITETKTELTMESTEITTNKPKIKHNSQKSLAIKVIEENNIVLVPQMGAFMVQGSNGTKYSVTLFPKESCTCPSTARCYHIIAAMMAIGMELPEDKKVFNLTQLRRNCRPKSNKKCGTKKGIKGDNDEHVIVNAAPDSILKSEQKINTVVTPSSKITKQHDSNSDVRRSLFTYSTPKSILKTPKSSSNGKKRKLSFVSPENNKNVKIPKINDLSTIEEATEMIELSDIRDDSALETENNMWIKNLKLTNDDKHIINDKNGKLHSQHMESVNKLLRKQFGNKIGGLQLPEKVPKFNDDKNTWTTFTPLQPSNEQLSCQIHHNHKDHWVTSIKCNNDIYLLDSLGNERPDDSLIPDGLKIQLSQIYGKNKNSVNIIIPPVQKQENSVDCGLFAIAQATSFCISQKPLLRKIFDTNKLRSHLLKCLENEEMTEFPTTKKNLSVRRIRKQKIISIELYCICNMPACLGNQVQCDKCLNWYHKHCVDAPVDISHVDVEFICSVCS